MDRRGCIWPFLVVLSALVLFQGPPAQAQQYTIYTVAGGALPPVSQLATAASINFPYGAAVDTAGNVYFTSMDSVFRIAPNGTLSRVTGNSRQGYSGDGGIRPRRLAAPRIDFRADSDLVLIPVSVTDSRNHSITGLGRDVFRIFEDRSEQPVVQFACEDAPLSVGIVFDSSGSMQGKLAKSREALV